MREWMGGLRAWLTERLPAIVYVVWAFFYLLMLSGGNYEAFLQSRFWVLMALGAGITILYVASCLARKPFSGRGHRFGEAGAWVRASLLILPMLFVWNAWGDGLGTYALSKRFIRLTTMAMTDKEKQTDAVAPDNASPAEASVLTLVRDPKQYVGKRVYTEGIVYRDEKVPKDHFVLFRFVITCCAADAQPVGILVHAENVEKLKNDTWVHAEGRFVLREFDGTLTACIEAESVDTIRVPAGKDQYLSN